MGDDDPRASMPTSGPQRRVPAYYQPYANSSCAAPIKTASCAR